jgi:uncharacterized protein DUF6894
MPHYHFHIHEDDRYYKDEAGRVLADGDAAREEAVETIAALAKDAFVAGSAEILTVDVIEGGKPYLRISVSLDVSMARQ